MYIRYMFTREHICALHVYVEYCWRLKYSLIYTK